MRVSPFVYFNEVPQVAAAGIVELPVTRGLYAYYDAGISASYSGSGTNINDLSPNNKDGTLAGTWGWVELTGIEGRVFRMGASGTGTRIDFPTLNPATTGEITFFLSFFIHPGSTYAFDAVDLLIGRDSQAYGILGADASPYDFRTLFAINDSFDLSSTPVNSATGSKWHIAGFSFKDSDNSLKYVADGSTGSLTFSSTMDSSNMAISWNSAGVPGRTLGSGSMTQVLAMYTSSLSTDELLQNYNAIKARYGL